MAARMSKKYIDLINAVSDLAEEMWPIENTKFKYPEEHVSVTTVRIAIRKIALLKHIAISNGYDPVLLQHIMDDV